LGYRPTEYELFGKPFNDRGAVVDAFLQILLSAFSAADPRAWTQPYPPIYVGGGVRATAERAARFGLPLSLPAHLPDVANRYKDLCKANGRRPVVVMPPADNRGMVYLHEDPDKGWAELGHHICGRRRPTRGGLGAERIPTCTSPRRERSRTSGPRAATVS
ncbi:MAG TPA: hypothetical protein VMU34_18185, partial [Mycobacterium sp.]|nr:hypothetical protein [Mycobacterium sp.]